MSQDNRKPILISGAGLASLLFAQSLRRASIPFIIFERDKSISFRAQGYRLRLSSEGLDAIESALDPEAFQRFWDVCGQTGGAGFASLDGVTGVNLPSQVKPQPPKKSEDSETAQGTKGNNGPEVLASRGGKVVGVARGEMRKQFMTGCEPFIQWSHSVEGYRLTSSGVRAIFADGTESVEGDMLVAGDGLTSKVAKQVSKGLLKVYDTGSRGVHGHAPTTAFKDLGEGVFRLVDHSNPQGKFFVITNVRARDMDDPALNFGWTLIAHPGVIEAPNNDFSIIGKPAADVAKSLTENWNPRFKPLFDQMVESEAAFWKITCSTPTGVPEWPNEPRVTVIGDAAHSMTPAGGIGANTAVRDSALLGKLLAEAGGYNDGITAAYEKEMRLYASEAVKTSYGLAVPQFGIYLDENSPLL
jgi:2-polyprenyl-6-methoxyphenol hydroxylase-like FAD-dependent oxidoreductase